MTKRSHPAMSTLVGSNLRRLRVAAGLTQEQLAAKCHRHRVWVTQIESERYHSTRTETLESLAKALGVEMSEFFRGAA